MKILNVVLRQLLGASRGFHFKTEQGEKIPNWKIPGRIDVFPYWIETCNG